MQPATTAEKKSSALMDLLNKDFKLFGNKLTDKKKEYIYSELHILLSSGLDIKTVFEIVIEEQEKPADKELIETIYQSIISGNSLSEAMHITGKFSLYEYYSIKIGEESGTLPVILSNLASFYNKKLKQKRKLSGALTYPILVLSTAVIAIVFMLNFIVPMFVDVFERFQKDLPALTQFIVNVSRMFSQKIGWVVIIIAGLVAVIIYLRRKPWYREVSSIVLLKLPVFGPLVRKIYLARFCQAMALLLGSKTPLLNAVKLIREMIQFHPFEVAMKQIESDIMVGKHLHETMAGFAIFDRRLVSLVKVGEEVNKLEQIFNQLNEQYSDELDHQMSVLSNMLEPILIIIVGILVAVILISMYLPLFQLSTSIL